MIRVLGLTLIVSGLYNVQQAYVSKTLQFKRFFFATLGGTLFSGALSVAMVYLGCGIWSLVALQLSNFAVNTLILWFTVHWRPKRMFSWERLGSLLSYGWKLLVSSFLDTAYTTFRIPGELLRKIAVKGLPLLVNELLWSSGMAILNQCYSMRGLEVVSAVNISSTVSNLFFCAFLSMGNAIAIIVGQLLGAGELERAVDEDRKLIAFSVALCAGVGVVMAFLAPLAPRLYNTSDNVRHIAAQLLLVVAVSMPLHAFTNSCYFTLRAGGQVLITFVFDSLYQWTLVLPLAFILSRFTALPILPMYIAVESLNLVKCALGFVLVRRRLWVRNLVG